MENQTICELFHYEIGYIYMVPYKYLKKHESLQSCVIYNILILHYKKNPLVTEYMKIYFICMLTTQANYDFVILRKRICKPSVYNKFLKRNK